MGVGFWTGDEGHGLVVRNKGRASLRAQIQDGLCKRNITSNDLPRALRALHRKVRTTSLRGGKWSGLGAQRLPFSRVLALLLCDLNGVM